MPRSSAHNLASALSDAPGPPTRSRPRIATPTLSMLLSAIFHAIILVAAAAVVWRTALAPPSPNAAGARVAFDNPGGATLVDAAHGPPTDSPPTPTPSFAPDHTTSPGSLAPLLSSPDIDTPIAGLSSGESSTPIASALSGLAGPSLASGSLFTGTSVAPSSSGAIAGVASGSPSVTFGGLGASSVSGVVYVVDCSGPMVTSLPIIIVELERSVARLSPSQRFGVVLFHRTADNGSGAESFAPVLVRATPSAKELLHNWLAAAEPSGRSSPLAGVELALSLKPDAVFLLSRSIHRSGGGVWELGLEPTMSKLEQLNPARHILGAGRPVLIQTIQFLDEDPTGIMQAIGTRHGGGNGYRVVKCQQDLQTPEPLKP